MSQTDAQAALAAAALIVSSASSTNGGPLSEREAYTLTMADAFMAWFRIQAHRPARRRPTPDERLVPNEDFKSPGHAPTELMTFSADLAATDARVTQIMASDPGEGLYSLRRRLSYDGPHYLSQDQRTPSGKYACLCGEAWPCSQRTDRGNGDHDVTEFLSLDELRERMDTEKRGGQ